MATTHLIDSPRLNRTAIQVGVLVALAILLATQDPQGGTPYALLGLAFLVAVYGAHGRPHRP